MSRPALKHRRFTVDDVHRMVEAGVLDEHEPVELIDGALVVMTPQGPTHRGLTVVILERLQQAFRGDHHVQAHSPVRAGPDSLPEPDVAVVRGPARAFLNAHPAAVDVPLVVEVAITSQAVDRAKASTYARAGFTAYWLLDVPARQLHVFTEPRSDGVYASERTYRAGDRVPVPTTPTELLVADLLP